MLLVIHFLMHVALDCLNIVYACCLFNCYDYLSIEIYASVLLLFDVKNTFLALPFFVVNLRVCFYFIFIVRFRLGFASPCHTGTD